MTSASHPFLRLFHATELQCGTTLRIVRCRAVADLSGGHHVDKRAQLVVELLLDGVPPKQPARDRLHAMQEHHAPSSTLVTANDTRFHRSRCCSSSLRPDAVSL